MNSNKTECINISRLFLESGKDLKIDDHIIVYHPTISRIQELGDNINIIDNENIYWNMVNMILSDPYDNMVMLDDMGIDYEEVSSFDVFLLQWKSSEQLYLSNKEYFDNNRFNPLDWIKTSLKFFLGNHNFALAKIIENNDSAIIDIDSIDDNGQYKYIITREVFEYIHTFISLMNCINNIDKINPATKSAKQILIQDKRDELERAKRNKKIENNNYLGLVVSAVCGGGNGSINYLNVGKHKIYQVLSNFKVIQNKTSYDHIMNGCYFGTVNMEKLNHEEINWIK